ncbi:YitT family protein [Ornithinibacillus sp. 4-3]|uniref:YitT family protein n=1 Tax=Ornithinibacillus sp. 4-3 TaxID=3231488 RepID=A0AB39HMS2_9BACI
MVFAVRFAFFIFGLILFSLGIAITVNMQHLGLQPWDVLSVALTNRFGLSFGTWSIIIGIILVCVAWILDRSYVKIGTFLNIIVIGLFVDLFLWLDFLPKETNIFIDSIVIIVGTSIVGFAGGLYNAAGLGSGPRDGFVLSIAEKLNRSISKVRIVIEITVVLIGFALGGPVFIFTFLLTFIQSPIFQYFYLKFREVIRRLDENHNKNLQRRVAKVK